MKKFLSILLAMCLCVSAVPLSGLSEYSQNYHVSAAGDATTPSVWNTTAKSFGINKIYTAGFTFVGSALTTIANTTDCDGFKKAVSVLNKYVFGTSSGQAMAEIKQLCNEILSELTRIENKLDTYTAQMEKMLGEQSYNTAKDKLDEKWEKYVSNVEKENNIGNTLVTYKKYIQVANEYKDGQATLNELETAKENLYVQFKSIYTSNGGTLNTTELEDAKREKIFTDSNVLSALNTALQSMTNNLIPDNSDSYAATAAQFAYEGLSFADEQYEFVKECINKQFTEILLLNMLTQEYLSEQGEYFEDKYPDNETVWNNYKTNVNLCKEYNVTIADKMAELLNSDLNVSSVDGISLKLDEYPKPEDATTMVMEILEYPYNHQFVKYNRVFTLTSSGINSFMILDGTQYDKEDYYIYYLYGDFSDTICHYIDFTDTPYSDGTNSDYRLMNTSADIMELFNTNAYTLCGSVPFKYLSDYLSYAGDQPIYLLSNDIDASDHVFGGKYATFSNVIDAKSEKTTFTSVDNGDSIDSCDYDIDGDNYETFYSFILYNNNKDDNGNTVFNQKTSVGTSGTGSAEIYIDDGSENGVTESTQSAGSEITIRFKATSDNTILNSLVMQRHNDVSDKSKVTSETTILERDDIYSISVDDDGYYEYTLNVPYSDVTFTLNTNTGHKVYFSEKNSDKLILDYYSNVYSAHETVNIIVDEEIKDPIYMKYDDILKLLTVSETDYGERIASFTMPDEDVTIAVHGDGDHDFGENGICDFCKEYQPAILGTLDYDFNGDGKIDENDKAYKISNMGQLYWFAELVNGTLDDVDQDTSANAVLTSDIFVNQGVLNSDGSLNTEKRSSFTAWTPIGTNYNNWYKGKFDGQNYKISGLYFNNSEQSNVGLFGWINNAEIKNVGVVDSYFNGYIYVGGICGDNYGTITNCYNSGTVSGSYNVGGICGYNNNYGTIINCYNSGTVSGTNEVGGICGDNYGTITNCYNSGTVSGTDDEVGGICGDNDDGIITNCYYLADTDDKNGGKTSAQFASGEVAYLLSQGCTIDEITYSGDVWGQDLSKDTYPVLGGESVYYLYDGIYTNIRQVEKIRADNYSKFGFTAENYSSYVGYYAITNADDLYWFAGLVNGTLKDVDQNTSANAVLTSDIFVNQDVLNSDGSLNSEKSSSFTEWTPMGFYDSGNDVYYAGKFDGQNHKISGLYFNNSNRNYVGLFGQITINAEIKNVGIVNSYVKGEAFVGGICGNNNGTIENCYNSGTVGSDSDSYSIGGICGDNGGAIINCYNSGNVSDFYEVGGICGHNDGTITNCYYLADTDDGNGGKTSAQFASGEVAYLLNGSKSDGAWGQTLTGADKQNYPVLGGKKVVLIDGTYSNVKAIQITAENYSKFGFKPENYSSYVGYYAITDADELYWFAGLVNGTLTDGTSQDTSANAVLTKDIFVNQDVLKSDGSLSEKSSSFTEWKPMGLNDDNSYNGKFDGQNHKISGLYFNDNSQNNVGLFGWINNAEIKNVGVVDSYFNGVYYVGGICAYNNDGAITNCYNSGSVIDNSGSAIGNGIVGGICAYNSRGKITNCYNSGSVIGNSIVGGICGYNSIGTIANCYNSGTVNASSSYYVGGVCGKNLRPVTNCYYLADTDDKNGGKTSTQFESGEVAYLLSQGCEINEVTYSGDAWGQDLSKDDYPTLGSTKVLANVDKSKFANDVLIYGQSATLDGTIGVNFYVTADDKCTDWTVTINGKDVAKPVKDSETGRYKFTYGVAAKDMKDQIQFVINLEGKEKDSCNTSVSMYLEGLEESETDEVKNLAKSMQTYGNAAEAYFGEKDVAEINDVDASAFADYGFTRGSVPDGIEYYGSSLILETETTIRHYFKLTGDKNINEFVFKVDGNEVSPVKKDGYYYIDVENISAENLGIGHTVSINDTGVIIIDYSAMSYAKAVVESDKTTDDLKNLVKALYKYNQSAVAYKN